jgi:hypothetical protein
MSRIICVWHLGHCETLVPRFRYPNAQAGARYYAARGGCHGASELDAVVISRSPGSSGQGADSAWNHSVAGAATTNGPESQARLREVHPGWGAGPALILPVSSTGLTSTPTRATIPPAWSIGRTSAIFRDA